MSDAFEDREKAIEAKWVHDETLRFRIQARRNRLLGEWAAAEMGLSGKAVQDYAQSVVAADLAMPGEEDVFRKVRADFDAAKVGHSDHVIRVRMAELMTVAAGQVMRETGK